MRRAVVFLSVAVLVVLALALLAGPAGAATAIEYGLIAALVSVAIIVMLGTLGDNLNATFKTVADQLTAAGGGT